MTKNYEDMNFTARFRNFNWEKARSFYVIAKTGSYTKAAHVLRVTQSALSRQVMDLKNALGVALFIRESRGVRLTRKGEELYSIIEPMFLEMSDFTRKTYAQTNGDKKRKIRICTTHAIATYIIDDYIFNYNEEHPHLMFELITDEQIIDIVLNDVDIAIRPFDPEVIGVQQEYLFTLEKRLYASQTYIDKYGEPKTSEDLKDHHIVAFARADDLPYADINWILKLGMPQGKLNEPIYMSSSIESIVKAAEKGLGIIANYPNMKIIRNSGLKNILPEIKDKAIEWHITIPNSLRQDNDILSFKSYLKSKLG